MPLKLKRNLIRSLTERAIKICTDDSIEQELEKLKHIFVQNGYPNRFILRTMEKVKQTKKLALVSKKRVDVNLHFKKESLTELITSRL